MGERKGTNHYYPPDYDPGKGGLNKFLGTHALRERARKLHLGILIIRFEMPYNIWCDGCGNHIGMGVRYNAEKKKVGMYYSTPVYQFRMKCHLCDNHFEIRTDPGNLDYVVVSGARRQENRWDPTQNGQVVPEDKETQRRLFDDAMFKLEHGEGDKTTGKTVDRQSRSLIARRDRLWQDDFAANSLLRSKFRALKRTATATEAKDKGLLKKFNLDMALVPEHDSDVKLAALLALKPSSSVHERLVQTRADIVNRPVLPSSAKVKRRSTGATSLLESMSSQALVRRKTSTSSVKATSNLKTEGRESSLTSSLQLQSGDIPLSSNLEAQGEETLIPCSLAIDEECNLNNKSSAMTSPKVHDKSSLINSDHHEILSPSSSSLSDENEQSIDDSSNKNSTTSPSPNMHDREHCSPSDCVKSSTLNHSHNPHSTPSCDSGVPSPSTTPSSGVGSATRNEEESGEVKVNVSLVSCLYNDDSSSSE